MLAPKGLLKSFFGLIVFMFSIAILISLVGFSENSQEYNTSTKVGTVAWLLLVVYYFILHFKPEWKEKIDDWLAEKFPSNQLEHVEKPKQSVAHNVFMGSEVSSLQKPFDPKTQVKEFKRTCNQCGKIWHSLASREEQIKNDASCNNCVQGTTACSGNLGAATQAKRNVESNQDLLDKLKKCPDCGSVNYKEEILIYDKK